MNFLDCTRNQKQEILKWIKTHDTEDLCVIGNLTFIEKPFSNQLFVECECGEILDITEYD